jgi:hypothetical protein
MLFCSSVAKDGFVIPAGTFSESDALPLGSSRRPP